MKGVLSRRRVRGERLVNVGISRTTEIQEEPKKENPLANPVYLFGTVCDSRH